MRRSLLALLSGILFAASTAAATACPFCSAVSQTLTERINTSDLAVLVELVEFVPQASDAGAPVSNEAVEAAKSTFRVLEVYRGEPNVKVGDSIKALYLGKGAPGMKGLLTGLDLKAPQWTLPVELSPRALDYLEQILKLPPKGIERLDFCEEFLEDSETLLQEDSLNEFAMADYPTIRQASKKYDRERLLKWIQDPKTAETRRRLYFTLLGTCGTPQDADVLEAMIRSGDAVQMRGLDALLACYLTLGGPQRLPLIEELFLKKKDADYTQTYAAIMAIRFHGQEGDIIPRQRAIEALRYMLDRPQLADLVIPDLARWEDWGSIDKLVELFKTSTKEWSYVRVPIINYLRACPKPEAKAKLEELAKLDPDSFKRAATFFPFNAGAAQQKPAETEAKKEPEKVSQPKPESGAASPAPKSGGTVALAMGTQSDSAAAAHQAGAAGQAPPLATIPPAGVLSAGKLRIIVGGATIGLGVLLFTALWLIIRIPQPILIRQDHDHECER